MWSRNLLRGRIETTEPRMVWMFGTKTCKILRVEMREVTSSPTRTLVREMVLCAVLNAEEMVWRPATTVGATLRVLSP